MTVQTHPPKHSAEAQKWSLDELGQLVNDFMEFARKGIQWEDAEQAAAGPYNFSAISQYISHRSTSSKYFGYIDLHYRERIDGDKQDAIILAYSDSLNGGEIGRLRITRA